MRDCPGNTCCDPRALISRMRITKSRGSPSGSMLWAIDHKFSPGCTTTTLVVGPCELPAASAVPLPKRTQAKMATSVRIRLRTTLPREVSTMGDPFGVLAGDALRRELREELRVELIVLFMVLFMGKPFRYSN